MTVLGKRLLTAAVLVPLVVAAILSRRAWPLPALLGTASALCAWEYYRMFFPGGRDRAAGVVLALLAFGSLAFLPGPAAGAGLLAVVALAAFHALPGPLGPQEKARALALFVLGTVWLGGFPAAYAWTRALPGGEHWVLLSVVATATGDTAAYAAGRRFGKRRLAPALSPNKTVEGAVAGLLASAAFGGLYAAYFLPPVPAWFAVGASGAVGAAGQAGDLVESLLKRAAGVKDSGALLPGHGGLFDRADAALAAAPAVYLLAALSHLTGGR